MGAVSCFLEWSADITSCGLPHGAGWGLYQILSIVLDHVWQLPFSSFLPSPFPSFHYPLSFPFLPSLLPSLSPTLPTPIFPPSLPSSPLPPLPFPSSLSGHRNVYVAVHVPYSRPKKHKHHRKKHHHKKLNTQGSTTSDTSDIPNGKI